MDFELTDEQVAMGVAVRRWLTDHAGDPRPAPGALCRAAAGLGWLGVTAPVGDGGLGLGLLDQAVVAEALGAGLAPASIGTAVAACDVVATSADPEQRARWLAPMVAGELVGSTALRAEGGSWDRHGIGVTATAGGRLDGDAGIVDHAEDADVLLVAAGTGDGPAVFVVETAQAGVSTHGVEPVDPAMRAAEVTLTDVPAERVRWDDDATFERIVHRLTVLVAADLVGAAGAALRTTLDHLRLRRQFGRAIGSFQAVQHELAELHVAWTTITDAVWYTADSHDAGRPDAALMTSVVKSRAADLARETAAAVVQFHGATGFSWEHSAHRYFKRLHRDAYDFGDSDWHDPIIAAAAIAADAEQHPGGVS
ncbi:acyl-CoA dehydrogenase family protein [Actinophytocola gossypii]|uniref:Acyl-CoA dehydrogenase family protein n=1 Tax=Actinophytocola gossypii TaxID=2812003 RepID=A0ABT2J1Y1_9PSEU|nr:acyl-CoA dehydrogenase family protein [Actinophytocola gossypii]MCT2581865.1 acyl-CoA dehydrogenase family protein [Actinophytocola gossypii]